MHYFQSLWVAGCVCVFSCYCSTRILFWYALNYSGVISWTNYLGYFSYFCSGAFNNCCHIILVILLLHIMTLFPSSLCPVVPKLGSLFYQALPKPAPPAMPPHLTLPLAKEPTKVPQPGSSGPHRSQVLVSHSVLPYCAHMSYYYMLIYTCLIVFLVVIQLLNWILRQTVNPLLPAYLFGQPAILALRRISYSARQSRVTWIFGRNIHLFSQ